MLLRPRAPVPRSSASSAMAPRASSVKFRSTLSYRKNCLYCLTRAFFGSVRMRTRSASSRLRRVEITGRRPTNSGMSPYFRRSSGNANCSMESSSCLSRESMSLPKPMLFLPMRWRMISSSPPNAPPQMNRTFLVSIWRKSWCGCLRPPCGGTGDGALEDLQQGLLHALTRDVARDRRVVGFPGDLVDLVDVDDTGLGLLHVEVCGLDQLEEDVLDVLADVAGLGQGCCVGYGERDVEDLRQRLGEERLARAGRPYEQYIGLLEFGAVGGLGAHLDALVVVVDGDGQDPFCVLLADHVLVEDAVDLPRLREVVVL